MVDPIIVYAALIDKEVNPRIDGIDFSVGEEYKLKFLSQEILQNVAESIISEVQPDLETFFADFNETMETERIEIEYSNGVKLNYPKWLFSRRGKTILNEVYNTKYTSRVINFSTLFKALRKLNLFPKDLIDKLNEIQKGG